MRWQTESKQVKQMRRKNWHRWFAWHPVQLSQILVNNKYEWLDHGRRTQWVWLETIERSIEPGFEGFDDHSYRVPQE